MKRDNYKEKQKMGMAATQGRLLALVHRDNDITSRKNVISMELLALSRETAKISKEYRNELSQKTLKWTNDGGMNYIDMSYANLMRPLMTSKESPYLITNWNGKVVVDNRYKQYAEMISPDGNPGGDYDSIRNQILAQIMGVNESDLDDFLTLEEATMNTLAEYNDLASYLPEDDPAVVQAYNVFLQNQSDWNSHFLYSQESQIHFYDDLFSSIAELGWIFDDQVGDDDRLNQMFQNGAYTLTKVDRNYELDGYFNVYETDIASNIEQAVLVNDNEKNQKALANYEYKKSKIKDKETLKNEEMNKLDVEQKSITERLESYKKMISDNIQRNFSAQG